MVCGLGATDEIVLTSGAVVTGVIEQETNAAITVYIGIPPRVTFTHHEIKTIRRATAEENAALRAAWAQDGGGEEPSEVLGRSSRAPGRARAASTPKSPRGPVVEGLNPGQRPPEFSARDLNGQARSLQAYQHRVVVLHFWATWCPHCRAEIPKLKTIQQRWAIGEVAILAVSVDEDLAQLQQFVKTNQLRYPVIADVQRPDRLASLFQVSGIPTTYVIGPGRLIRHRFGGRGDLVGAVQRVMESS